MHIYLKTELKCSKKALKKAQRPKKALDPSKSHHFEAELCGPLHF
jgi:hypothetical protein